MSYIFLEKYHCIYDTKFDLIRDNNQVYMNTWLKPKDIREQIWEWNIKTYNDLCYSYEDQLWNYNLLKRETIIEKWIIDPCYEPKLHPLIEKLFYSLCWWNDENINYLHNAVLHKYKNIDDVFMPCVIFHGTWWSGKNTFINLLSSIFGEENTQVLDWKSLKSNFSPYTWKKIIVSFDEVESNWYDNKSAILTYLKSVVFAPKISIEEKFQKRMTINNIAWFFLLSNSSMPIVLDEKDKWNRRFTVIRSNIKLNETYWELLYKITQKKTKESIIIIQEYLQRLEKTFWKTSEKRVLCLQNEEKRDLEEKSETVGNLFFERFENKYPKIKRITVQRFNNLLYEYREFIWDNTDPFDDRYKPKYFNLWLGLRYKQKIVNFDWVSYRMYVIQKEWEDFLPININ